MASMEKNREPIGKLLNPKSIAVIGASGTIGKAGNIIFSALRYYDAKLYPVNPHESSLFGYKVYPSIGEVPGPVDVAIITVGARLAVEVAEECARAGAEILIIVAGGFGESGSKGKEFEQRLKALPGQYGCRILGPNSLGVFVPATGFDTIFVEHGDKALAEGGSIAFITQSGSVGVESLGLASNTGYGMRAFIGLGNKIDLNELDFLHYFGRDEQTGCLALYVESIEEGRGFLTQAKAISRKKPVIILKAGRTPAGASAVSSHTGRLAGSDKVISGAFRQYGIQRALDDEELCDASKALASLAPAAGGNTAIVTGAGGFGVMCTDYIESADSRAPLSLAELSQKTVEKIRSFAPAFASCRNPVDLTASMDNAMMVKTLQALIDDQGVDIIICIAFFAPPSISDTLIEDIADVVRGCPKPVLVFTEYGPYTEHYLKEFYKNGVIGFPSISRTVRAARFLVERGRILAYMEEDDAQQ